MQLAYVVIWWLTLLIIGLITFPLVSRLCGGLQDKGYSISKILGLLLLTYFSWLLASAHILKFGYSNIIVSFILLLALSFLIGRKHLDLKSMPWRSILITEALFAVAFGLFLFYLSHRPDLHITYSEDFMDFGFMRSIMRSDYLPPADPWLAGESISYYYGGHMVGAVLTTLSRVPPPIAYNLAVAMSFALAVCAAYGLGYNATKKRLYGFGAVIFVCVAGFISGAFQLAAYFSDSSVMGYDPSQALTIGDWFRSFEFVQANWIIFGAVTHYPFYAYLVGDLHANVMDIPFQLMFMTLVLSLLAKNVPAVSGKADSLLKVCILGLSLGFFAFVNTWSYPIYLAFLLLAFLLLEIKLSWKGIIGVVVLSLLLFLPYHLSRGSGGFKDLGIVGDKTNLLEFFEIFALPLFVMFAFFLVLFTRKWFKDKASLMTAAAIAVLTAGVSALFAVLLDVQIIWVLAPLFVVPFYYIFKSRRKEEPHFMLLLIFTGALVVLFCEIYFINDPLGGEFERYNTILKMYMPIWVIWAVPAAYAVYFIMNRLKGSLRAVWSVLLLVFVLAALVHPIASSIGWTGGKYSHVEGGRLTLDGMAYLEDTNRGDYEAIQWLNANVEGSHVILEAPGVAMEYSSPASALTGLPTVLGWAGWEVMWRGDWNVISERTRAIDVIYNAPDSEEAANLLKEYKVEYIYVGTLEKKRYGADTLLKFASPAERYTLVYKNEDVSIYEVNPYP
jgi:YYY domain-containing protein